jgi:integrase
VARSGDRLCVALDRPAPGRTRAARSRPGATQHRRRTTRARRARIVRVRGKGKTERSVFLSADARTALANYLDRERSRDATPTANALFLSAPGIPARAINGRLSPRAINLILNQIGRWHDAEIVDPERHVAPLRPHDLRHTFGFQLAKVTGTDAYELERRLGHRSQRYIQRYTNPPEAIAAGYVEGL